MNTHRKAIIGAALLVVVVALSGCGGGGGGGGSTPQLNTDPINITSANAVQVASVTLSATDFLAGFDAAPIFGIASSSANSATSTKAGLPLTDFVSSQLRRLQALVPQAGSGVTIAVTIPPETIPCLVSGTLTVSGNIADPTLNTLIAGDVMTGTFNSCDDGDGVVVSGTITLTVQAFTGNLVTPPYSVTVLISFSNLSLTGAGETLSVDGNVTYVESTLDGVVFTDTLSGDSLSFSESTGDTGKLTSFVVNSIDDFNTLAYSVDSSGTVATMQLGGSVQYETTTTFEGVGADYPSSGVMVVTGAANSSETITVVNSIDLTIGVDADGNGVIDQTINTTWDAL